MSQNLYGTMFTASISSAKKCCTAAMQKQINNNNPWGV